MKLHRVLFMSLSCIAAAGPSIADVVDGYRPQNDAQRNYKACKMEAITKGQQIVLPFCGAVPERPKYPSYDEAWNKTSKDMLDVYTQSLTRFEAAVSRYQTCISNRVMADGSLPTSTLDYAACADQGAVEKLAQSSEEFGMTCMAYNDSQADGTVYTKACFPTE